MNIDCNTLQHTATHCNTLQHTATQVYARIPQCMQQMMEVAEEQPPVDIDDARFALHVADTERDMQRLLEEAADDFTTQVCVCCGVRCVRVAVCVCCGVCVLRCVRVVVCACCGVSCRYRKKRATVVGGGC